MTVSIQERAQPGQSEVAWSEVDDQSIFLRLGELPERDGRRDRLRTELVRRHLRLVDSLAAHYRGRGEPLEDIVGAGRVGLIKAIDRFDPARGHSFAGYATCMIVGEIKRHFRDTTWAVHVPRRLQELRGRLRTAARELAQAGIADPTARQLAAHLAMDEEEVREACVASNAYSSLSLDAQISGDAGIAWTETLGEADSKLDRVVDFQVLRGLLANLPERDRTIILLRFYGNRTQSEIADQLGLSQMHVSRLLSRTLESLRQAFTGEDETVAADETSARVRPGPGPEAAGPRSAPACAKQTDGERSSESPHSESPSVVEPAAPKPSVVEPSVVEKERVPPDPDGTRHAAGWSSAIRRRPIRQPRQRRRTRRSRIRIPALTQAPHIRPRAPPKSGDRDSDHEARSPPGGPGGVSQCQWSEMASCGDVSTAGSPPASVKALSASIRPCR
jgi:RNA polymerase sigma-B factor